MFEDVTKSQSRLRMVLDGPAGSGKTYTALRFAFGLSKLINGKVAVIDTERGSAAKYKGENPDGIPWIWKHCNLQHFAPSTYEQAIRYAGQQGYEILVIDSLSHAWQGTGGALEQVDRASSRGGGGGSNYFAWREVTPQHNSMVDSILQSPCHIIATMRSKMEHLPETDERGKITIRKIGLKPIQREGMEYEFDIVCDIDEGHTLKVSKTRCSAIDGKIISKPNAAFMDPIKAWLFEGEKAYTPFATQEESQPMAAAPTNGNGNGLALSTATLCHPNLIADIKRFAKDLGFTPTKLKEILLRKNVSRIADLTQPDALGLANRLKTKILEQEGKEAFS